MELIRRIEQQIKKQMEADPAVRTFIGRAALILRGLADRPDYIEFPAANVIARSMGAQKASDEQRALWESWGGQIAAEAFPPEAADADRTALGDALRQFVCEQTKTERWAYEHAAMLSNETPEDDEDDDRISEELDEVDREHALAASLVAQGRAILAHLCDDRAGRHVSEG